MKNSKIEWTHHTFNPWIGCTKVSPACNNCYAAVSTPARTMKIQWGAGQPRKRTSDANWREPIRWNAECAKRGVRERVFCASLADVFDNEVPQRWRQKLMSLVAETPMLDWLFLTKRVGNAKRMLSDASMHDVALLTADDHYLPPKNLWIGATICNQEEADRDIPKLLATPAAKWFLSIEPMLGPVDLSRWLEPAGLDTDLGLSNPGIDLVIVGGESGPNARPMHPDWARSLRDQCQVAGVPFFFKQWGEWVDADNGPDDDSAYEGNSDCWAHIEGGHHSGEMGVDFFSTYPMYRVGKKAAGRMLDGREWDEVPA